MKKAYTLKTYLDEERGRAKLLCQASGIAPGWLSQMKLGTREIPPIEAMKIDRATAGAVPCESSCPKHADLFAYIRATGVVKRDPPDPARAE